LFPFPLQPRKASKIQTSQTHNFPSCKTQKKPNQSSKTKNKKNKRSKTKESPKHKKKQTPSSEHKSSKTKVPSIQSSQHKEEAKPKESSKQTPPKLLTLNLLRCNRTCFYAAAAAAATTTTAIPLQLQSSRKLHYPTKAQNFCFSLQQPNDDFCVFSPFFEKLFEKKIIDFSYHNKFLLSAPLSLPFPEPSQNNLTTFQQTNK
jgi:hypothetical protein